MRISLTLRTGHAVARRRAGVDLLALVRSDKSRSDVKNDRQQEIFRFRKELQSAFAPHSRHVAIEMGLRTHNDCSYTSSAMQRRSTLTSAAIASTSLC